MTALDAELFKNYLKCLNFRGNLFSRKIPFFDGFSRIKFSRISRLMYFLSVFVDLIFADFADETLSNRLFLYF